MTLFTARRLAVAVCLAVAAPLVSPSYALDPSQPPCNNFDLSHWKITLPIDSSYGTSGTAVEVPTSDLTNPTWYTQSQYTDHYAPYFYTSPSDGSLVMYTPSTGATTGNSTHTRTELREVVNPGNNTINWSDQGTHILTATALVSQMPSGNKTIVGQVHGVTPSGGNANPLVKLLFEVSSGGYRLRALCHQTTASSSTEDQVLFPGTTINLNSQFTYQIIVKDKTYRIVVNGVNGTISGKTANPDGSYTMDSSWDSLFFYFKAGNYNQNSTQDSSVAIDQFYAITRTHQPTITTTSLASGTTGSAYSATLGQVGAIGNAGNVTWTLASGSLPSGLSLSSSGTISGTPTAGGTFAFTVKVTDEYGYFATQALSLTVSGNSVPNITTTSLPGATVGTAYSQTVSSTGGDAPLAWSVSSGSLPAGLSLSNVNAQNCTISGTPTTAGTSNFTVRLADVNSDVDTQALSIAVTSGGGGGGGGGASLTATADGSWQTATMAAQTGSFTTTFDAVPSASPTDAVVGLSSGAQSAYSGYACLVRFNTSGDIDVRNGGAYSAAATVPFSAGTSYHFRIVSDTAAHTYSVYVTPAGGSEITLASNYAFRSEQSSVSSLDHWGTFVNLSANGGAGSLSVTNFLPSAAAPTFSVAGGTYTSAQTVSLASTTSGVSIRYTEDGSTPSSSAGTLYAGPITVSASETVKAIAYSTGLTDSSVASATYTISGSSGGTLTDTPGGAWQTTAFTSQTGTFSASTDVTLTASPNNAVVGLALGAPSGYSSCACLVRFNSSGKIDVRNGGNYGADTSQSFAANTAYHLEFVVNVSTHTYSVYVTAAGGSQVTLASNYAFRTEQNTVTNLDHWGVYMDASSSSGSISATNLNVSTQNPAQSPGQNFADLAYWYLTLPTGTQNSPDTVQPSTLSGTYQDSPYFYTGADGAMVFWAPVTGVHTSGSSYARCELRELISGTDGDTGTNWTVNQFGKSYLKATLAVNAVPSSTQDIGIGQIHENGGNNKPFVLLHYTNGSVHAKVLNAENGSTYTDLTFANVPLNTTFTYELEVTNTGTLHIFVNGVEQKMSIDSTWLTVPLYFKAGVYTLGTGTSSSDGGKTSFYSLTRYHGAM